MQRSVVNIISYDKTLSMTNQYYDDRRTLTAAFEFSFFATTSTRSIKSAKKEGVVNIRKV
jgi:hypothetical protein